MAILAAGILSQAQNFKAIPDSLIYYLDEYAEGRITFANGQFGDGLLNICTLDQAIRFKEKGQIQALSNNSDAEKVSIGGSLFIRNKETFVQNLDVADGVGLGVTKTVLLLPEANEGAFGGHDETTSTTKYGSLGVSAGDYNRSINSSVNSQYFDLSQPIRHNYDYKEKFFLYKNNRFTPISRKALEKAFPDKKM